jgi:hypothetical protein
MGRALFILAAGLCAAWLAAGSCGMTSYPLQRAATWYALCAAVVAALPEARRTSNDRLLLAGLIGAAVLISLLWTPAGLVFAVAIVLAGLAKVSNGIQSRSALIAAVAAAVLGLFSLANECIPAVFHLTNAAGQMLGWLAGTVAAQPLVVGRSYGGIDFLVLAGAYYIAWLVAGPRPRLARALAAAAAIAAAHLAYLIVLAYCDQLGGALPEPVEQPNTDNNRVGIWTWGDWLRTFLPWNLPLAAAALHTAVAVVMFRWAPPAVGEDAEALDPHASAPRTRRREAAAELRNPARGSRPAAGGRSAQAPDSASLEAFAAVALSLLLPVACTLAGGQFDLAEKTVLAYGGAALDWEAPSFDRPEPPAEQMFGLLPRLVQSLGGRVVLSRDLSAAELEKASVLLVAAPDGSIQQAALERVWQYVRRGGSLLVVASPLMPHPAEGAELAVNQLLQPSSMRVRFDTAVPAADRWEHCFSIGSHPVVFGMELRRNRFALHYCASIETGFSARPILIARHAWGEPGSQTAVAGTASYNGGKRLGDLVLAAEQRVGKGRVLVLGDVGALTDDGIPSAWEFTGRMLAYLASGGSAAQSLWRQAVGLLCALGLAVLWLWRLRWDHVALSAAVLCAALLACGYASSQACVLLPDGSSRTPNNLAYIDASHLEAYSSDTWSLHGTGWLSRILAKQGYLPLLAYGIDQQRLQRAGLMISIGPAKPFTAAERANIQRFVEGGGTLIVMAGAEHAEGSRQLLADFRFRIVPSPLRATSRQREPDPIGAQQSIYLTLEDHQPVMRFYAAWPVECDDPKAAVLKYGLVQQQEGEKDLSVPTVVAREVGLGYVAVIGDTYFAVNENFERTTADPLANVNFWRWMISRVTHVPEWFPPKPAAEKKPPSSADLAPPDKPREPE